MTTGKITMLIISILAVGLLTMGVMALAGNGNGPGDGLGYYENQTQDGSGYRVGNNDCDRGGNQRALTYNESGSSYGPGDGTGCGDDRPQDGTGYGAICSPSPLSQYPSFICRAVNPTSFKIPISLNRRSGTLFILLIPKRTLA